MTDILCTDKSEYCYLPIRVKQMDYLLDVMTCFPYFKKCMNVLGYEFSALGKSMRELPPLKHCQIRSIFTSDLMMTCDIKLTYYSSKDIFADIVEYICGINILDYLGSKRLLDYSKVDWIWLVDEFFGDITDEEYESVQKETGLEGSDLQEFIYTDRARLLESQMRNDLDKLQELFARSGYIDETHYSFNSNRWWMFE